MNDSKDTKDEGKNCQGCCGQTSEKVTAQISKASVVAAQAEISSDEVFAKLRIEEMDCAAEEAEIRRALSKIETIRSLRFNLGKRELGIDADADSVLQSIEAIRKAGFTPKLVDEETDSGKFLEPEKGFWATWGKLLGSLILAILAEILDFAFTDVQEINNLGMALAGVAIIMAGLDVYVKGLKALTQGRLNINALMTVAVTGAFLIGQWPEAAMVMALYAIAEAIEAKAVDRARNAIKSLMALTPENAEVQQSDGSWKRELVKDIQIDAKVRVKPGERIPLDGIVTAGQSAVDQSPVTGESLPIDKSPADEIYAGTINQASEALLLVPTRKRQAYKLLQTYLQTVE